MLFPIAIVSFTYRGCASNHPLALRQPCSLFGRHFQRASSNHYHNNFLPMNAITTSLSMTDDYGNILSGLTEDGDFAILGVNARIINDDDENDNVEMNRQNSNTGTSIGWQGVGNMLFNEPLLNSGNVDIGVGPTNRYRNFRGNQVFPKEVVADPQVREWLMEVLPSLDESEVECYAQGLSTIGFRPQCIEGICLRRSLVRVIRFSRNSISLEEGMCKEIV